MNEDKNLEKKATTLTDEELDNVSGGVVNSISMDQFTIKSENIEDTQPFKAQPQPGFQNTGFT